MINRRGYTLIEFLTYIGIFSLVFVFVLNVIFTTAKAYNKFRITKDLKINAEFSLEKLAREIKLSMNIDYSKSVFNVNPGKLYLNSMDQVSGVPGTMEIEIIGDALSLKWNNSPSKFFTSSSTKITSLIFKNIESSASRAAIKIELELTAKRGNEQKSEKFYTTAILKNGY